MSLTERKPRLTLIAKVASKEADTVNAAILQQLAPLSDNVHTLTSDNGREFARHQAIAKALNATFYFAHPRLQRAGGLNENTNGLIRQYFPKDRDFTAITEQEIRA